MENINAINEMLFEYWTGNNKKVFLIYFFLFWLFSLFKFINLLTIFLLFSLILFLFYFFGVCKCAWDCLGSYIMWQVGIVKYNIISI